MGTVPAVLFLLLFASAPVPPAVALEPFPGETTWESPTVSTQLFMDESIIPVGKGAVFCPVMTQPENEPPFGILENGRTRQAALMGSRIVVAPGIYTVVLGSGIIDQMIQKKVRVEEGATTLIKPDWAALVVEVINQTRSSVRESYELLDAATGKSYGVGQGVAEDLDQRLRTWILPPGLYKLVKPGDNLIALVNFGTIRLLPGELVRTNLVVNQNTGDFVGFGQVTDIRQDIRDRGRARWTGGTELSGNMLLNYVPAGQSGSESESGLAASVQLLSDQRYQSGRHVIPIWANLEEGLSMNRNREVSKFADNAEMRLTYIYRLSKWVSPYLRGAVQTSLFVTHYRLANPTDYVELNASGDTLRTTRGGDRIRLSGPLSPIQIKRGAGITAALVQTIPVNLNVRGGYGSRQTFSRGAGIYDPETHTLRRVPEVDVKGTEMLTLADLRLGRYVIFNGDFDLLIPALRSRSWVYDSENRFRVNLTRHVNLVLQLNFQKEAGMADVQARYQALLRFSQNL